MFYSDGFIKKVRDSVVKITMSPSQRKSIEEALLSHNEILGDYFKQLLKPPSWEMIRDAFDNGTTAALNAKAQEMKICKELLDSWEYLRQTQEKTIQGKIFLKSPLS